MFDDDSERLYIKCTLVGEPARIVRELKERGIVKSVREAVVCGILTFYDVTIERDLKRAQAKANKRTEVKA